MLLRLLVVTGTAALLGTWGAWVLAETPQQASPEAAAAAAKAKEDSAREYFTDLELLTQDGEKVRFYTDVLKDKVVVISFIFTNCQDACPMMTRKLTLVRDMLDHKLTKPLWFVSLSVDPERDTPEALKKFAKDNKVDHDGWVFLTGEPQKLNYIIRKLGQYTEEVEAHSTLVLAGNVNEAHWIKIPPMIPPEAIAERLRGLMGEGIAGYGG
jgi:cytochrome oxidase Cu insertion factor (SCO1/SenC/PrrC family)